MKVMKAIEYRNYGPPEVLRLKEIPRPSPKQGEVLVKVHAATVTGADLMMRTGKPWIGRFYTGLKVPKRKVLGFEFAGEIVDVGKAVKRFKTGDMVFGGTTTLGCYAQYVCVHEDDVIMTMPDTMTYEEAAPVNGSAVTVMNFLKGLGNLQKGQKVLINGASGGLGTYAVQIAKHFGAEVTGVCSTVNMDLVKSLGADYVIDYTQQDFTKNGKRYDLIFDTVYKCPFRECKNSLTQKGMYLSPVISFPLLMQIVWTSVFGTKKVKTSATGMLPAKVRLAYFMELKALLGTGKIKTVIDSVYPLSLVAAAHEYVQKGHKKGNVVIVV